MSKANAAFSAAEKATAESISLSGLTRAEWFQLPLSLRVEWWRATDYGQKPPPLEMIEKLRAAVLPKK